MNYSWFNQQSKNGQKLIQNALEWKRRNVVRSQTPKTISFMNKEKQIYKLNIPSK